MKTRNIPTRVCVTLIGLVTILAFSGCRSAASKAAREQQRNTEQAAKIAEKDRRVAEKEQRAVDKQKRLQESQASLSDEQLRFKFAGLEQAIARGTEGMNILLASGNGVGALIAQGQIEAKVKERDAVGMELARRATTARSAPPTAKPEGDGPAGVRGTGSGFFITTNGYFVTCAHVVERSTKILIRTKAGTFPATVLRRDEANDVAVLKADGSFMALPLVSSSLMKRGEHVFTIGFPKPELQGFEPKYTSGDISAVTGIQDNPGEFQISVPVQPGNSGGALVNKNGAAIGVVASKLKGQVGESSAQLPENVNYAVKSSYVLLMLESLPSVSSQLLKTPAAQERKQEEVIQEAEDAVGLVIVY